MTNIDPSTPFISFNSRTILVSHSDKSRKTYNIKKIRVWNKGNPKDIQMFKK